MFEQDKDFKLFEGSGYPVQQNRVYETKYEAINCLKGDVVIIQNHKTGLIYNSSFDTELMVYDESYDNEQSHSKAFQCHLEEVLTLVKQYLGTKNLIEVGCGKGYFLEKLLASGVSVLGFDPTYAGDNDKIVKSYFSPDLISSNTEGLILRHVLEHIPDPVSFLENLKHANGGKGKIYIEVPCFDWIVKNRMWFDIFYEHVNYFRLRDFNNIFSKVHASGTFFGGQYIYIIADLQDLRVPVAQIDDRLSAVSQEFFQGINSLGPKYIWGASSKGVIYALNKVRAGQQIDYAIDVNPAKQGKFMPVTGIEIVSPSNAMHFLEDGAEICVLNPNYLKEIDGMTKNKFRLTTFDNEKAVDA